jgi:hypothetical protein
VIEVAVRIIKERPKEDAKGATYFLRYLSEERFLQAAMMADAAHETSSIIRMCDKEAFDTAEMCDMLAAWKSRVTFLFFENGVTTTQSFTAFALKVMSRVHVVEINGEPKGFGSLGGVAAPIIDRCLKRMRCWHRLALSVLDAEFPSFEVWASFGIFKLSRPDTLQSDRSTERDEHFRRLAKAFGVNASQLKAQFDDHEHFALALKSTGTLTNGEAWSQAVMKTAKRADVRKDHPVSALLPVLQRYRAYNISTSGVEQAFSMQDWLFGGRSNHQSDDTAAQKTKLTVDYNKEEELRIVKAAQRIYSAKRTGTRSRSTVRRDSGMHKKTDNSKTEKGWLQRRHASLSEAMQHKRPLLVSVEDALAEDMDEWQETHEKEKTFQEDKRKKRKVEAYRAGTLLDEEVSEDLVNLAREAAKADAKRSAQHRQAAQRKQQQMEFELPADESLQHKQIFVDDRGIDEDSRKHVDRRCAELRMARVASRKTAEFTIVANPADLGARTEWANILAGRTILSVQAFCERAGPSFRFCAAVKTERQVYCTDAFKECFAQVWDLMKYFNSALPGKWTFVADLMSFARVKRAAIAAKKSSTCICIATAADIEDVRAAVVVGLSPQLAAKAAEDPWASRPKFATSSKTERLQTG